ncbi:MAG: DUF2974 domain-containing protein, partial [Oscillospiraceae bacterium]|nr:DUF2974 domain-containing protein [Oscillospiraceae bacterium]
ENLEADFREQHIRLWNPQDIYRLMILKNAVERNPVIADSVISNLTISGSGMSACIFIKPDGEIHAVFKGTGSGEWIDNGEGLSGIPEENTYIDYDKKGEISAYRPVQDDYATDQQVEALNWFNRTASLNGWNESRRIIISGHSKGGNKAQFITMHSDIIDECYSFNGQGFSPEAINAMKGQFKEKYDLRRNKIYSLASDNDFVNVLGIYLVPETHIYYFEASLTAHPIEHMLYSDGSFRDQCEQGWLSRYTESISSDLMRLTPAVRRYAARGIMNIFQKYVGKDDPVNGGVISKEETLAGISIAAAMVLRRFRMQK